MRPFFKVKLGRIRLSTLALLVAFVALFWLHQTFEPAPQPGDTPATQIVPPGFVPDPDYTWVPRTDVRQSTPEPTTTTATPTTTPPLRTTTTSPGATTSPTSPTVTTTPTSPATAPTGPTPTTTAGN